MALFGLTIMYITGKGQSGPVGNIDNIFEGGLGIIIWQYVRCHYAF